MNTIIFTIIAKSIDFIIFGLYNISIPDDLFSSLSVEGVD